MYSNEREKYIIRPSNLTKVSSAAVEFKLLLFKIYQGAQRQDKDSDRPYTTR